MAGVLQHLRSSTLDKRPNPASMVDGQVAINYASGAPGMFFKDSNGDLVKVGPVHVGSGAPNAVPASGGTAGNSIGEQWLDTSGGTYVFKIWDGSAWRSEAGEFVNVTGDTMTGALGIIAGSEGSPSLFISGDTGTGLYSPGANQLAISTNGTGRLFIDSSGKVGLGSSDPASRLDMSGGADGTLSALTLARGNSSGKVSSIIGTSDSTNQKGIQFNTYNFTNLTPLTITPDGKVGIGTTSPGYLVHAKQDTGAVTQIAIENASAAAGAYAQLRIVGDAGLGYLGYSGSGSGGVGLYEQDWVYLAAENTTGGLNLGAAASTGAIRFFTNGASATSERARIDSSGRLLVGTPIARSNFFNAAVTAGLQVEGVADESIVAAIRNTNTPAEVPVFLLARSRGTSVGSNTLVISGDELGYLSFQGNDGSQFVEGARISAAVDGTSGANDLPTRLVFSTTADGASSPTERMRITSGGQIRIQTPNQVGDGYISAVFDGNTTSGLGLADIQTTGTFAKFYRSSATEVGSISHTSTATAYNTSSDYRLKENVTPVSDGITRLQQLKPSRFNFIADPDTVVDGFLAHEVQAIVPEAITGEKDAVDDDGNPEYQGIDQSKLVPLLTAALQEAIGEIESLKARVAALEAN